MRIAAAAAIILLAGCPFNVPPADDEPARCTESRDDCVCLVPAGVCVQCTVDDERNCSGATPQCGGDNLCRGCRADDECASSACLEDGACADASRVIYARQNGANTAGCGLAPGQNECTLKQALLEVTGQRDIIRAAPDIYNLTDPDGLDFARSATLIARGSTIRRAASSGPLATVRPGQTMKLVGATLQGPNQDDGIRCNGGKVEVHEATIENMSQSGIEGDSCELTIARSAIRNNLRGGINMIGDPRLVQITNNFVYRNGESNSTIGGMLLRVTGASRVELNTVVDNAVASTGGAGGIECQGTYDPPYNLIFRNRGGVGDMVQVIGTCSFQKSHHEPAPAGDNSVGFEDPNNVTRPSFRLTQASPAGTIRDAFDCTGADFEGDRRPDPTGGRCDLGADELRAGQ